MTFCPTLPFAPRWLRPAGVIAGMYVLPVVLITTGLLPFQWRFYVLLAMTVVAAVLAVSRHSGASLGFTRPRAKAWLAAAVLPTAAMLAFILLSGHTHRIIPPAHLSFYLFFVLVSAPAQEFLYRGFLFAELAALRLSPKSIVLLSTALFGFMHIIYRDPLTVALTLAAGLVWGILFHSTRKFFVVAASHAALGVVAIFLGVV